MTKAIRIGLLLTLLIAVGAIIIAAAPGPDSRPYSRHARVSARPGESPIELLHRFDLDHRHLPAFRVLNNLPVGNDQHLGPHEYRIPVLEFDFDGQNIRHSLGIPMAEAVAIREYNRELALSGVKRPIFDDRRIWVPCDNVLARASAGSTSEDLLNRYGLGKRHLMAFNQLNGLHDRGGSTSLEAGHVFRLPIHILPYEGPTIAQDLDYSPASAHQVAAFNRQAHLLGLKPQPWEDHVIWLPFQLGHNPVYGPIYQDFEIVSNQLENCVFYLSPGHGGPDPGTFGSREGTRITEDEYVYDITLRLARELEKQGAEVVMVVEDEGIRDIKFLAPDREENLLGGMDISADMLTRLQDRARLVNLEFQRRGGSKKHQRFLAVHIDFRPDSKKHVDFDVYHFEGSKDGKRLAKCLEEYLGNYHDGRFGDRQLRGKMIAQTEQDSFFMLRETTMPAALVELANIGNALDQLRFIVISSRQKIAELLCAGLVDDFSEGQSE